MIQRIQSLWILLAIIMVCLFYSIDAVSFMGEGGAQYSIKSAGIYSSVNGAFQKDLNSTVLLILVILITVLLLVTLFIYKYRKLQIKISFIVLILQFSIYIVLIIISSGIHKDHDAKIFPELGSVFPFLGMIFTILACRGIKKDENLVRSYDRLR